MKLIKGEGRSTPGRSPLRVANHEDKLLRLEMECNSVRILIYERLTNTEVLEVPPGLDDATFSRVIMQSFDRETSIHKLALELFGLNEMIKDLNNFKKWGIGL